MYNQGMETLPALKHVAIRLHPELYQQLRLAVVQQKTTIQQALLDAIQQWLAKQQAEEDATGRRKRIEGLMGLYAHIEPERILSEELIAERRAEAAREESG